jgi:hypothetical protein
MQVEAQNVAARCLQDDTPRRRLYIAFALQLALAFQCAAFLLDVRVDTPAGIYLALGLATLALLAGILKLESVVVIGLVSMDLYFVPGHHFPVEPAIVVNILLAVVAHVRIPMKGVAELLAIHHLLYAGQSLVVLTEVFVVLTTCFAAFMIPPIAHA